MLGGGGGWEAGSRRRRQASVFAVVDVEEVALCVAMIQGALAAQRQQREEGYAEAVLLRGGGRR